MNQKDIINELDNFNPIKEFKFGHTPLQIEFFQTNTHKGSRKFEYWQHVLQLKSLRKIIKETEFDIEDAKRELKKANKFLPFFTRSERKLLIPRLSWKVELLNQQLQEKITEAKRHLDIIKKHYADLKDITEDEIFEDEQNYWVTRLTRQITFAHLANKFQLPLGDITAIMSLPNNLQIEILNKAVEFMKEPEKAYLVNLNEKENKTLPSSLTKL